MKKKLFASKVTQEQTVREDIWTLVAPVKSKIRWAMALGAVSSVAALCAIALLAWIIHVLLSAESSPWPWVLANIALVAIAVLTRIAAMTISHHAAFELEPIIRLRLAEHLARVPLGYLVNASTGALTKVLQDDVKSLHGFVADTTPMLGRSYAAQLTTLIFLLAIDWRLAILAVLVLAIGMVIIRMALGDSVKTQKEYDDGREKINSAIIEFVQAMPVVRTFDDGSSSFVRYQSALDQFHRTFVHWMSKAAVSSKLGIVLLGPLPTLAVLTVAGAWLYTTGETGFTSWVATLLLGCGLAESLMPAIWLSHFIRKANMSARRIYEILHVKELPESSETLKPRDASIEFDHVTFAYEGRSVNAVSGVSFTVPAGSVTALVGSSGAGKSTVAKLIPRFWDVTQGRVLVGGVDVKNIATEELMKTVGFVFQDNFLFHDTIFNNIRLGCPDATLEDVQRAARSAQAHDFIMNLPQGYETVVGDRGVSLSGGQRQRITIARTLLRNSPIVVLDEPTSYSDPENEAAMIEALVNLMRGRTVVIVAHRLNTIRGVDQILAFDRGVLMEKGTHEELVKAQGIYARLWQSYEAAQGWSMVQTGKGA